MILVIILKGNQILTQFSQNKLPNIVFHEGKGPKINKYAIHAYTHGPVTGSGPSVKPLKYVTHLLVAS